MGRDSVTQQEIRTKVKELTKRYGTSNPFELCDLMGINVEKEPLGNLDGYYHYFNRIKQIRLNESLDNYRLKWTCAHELGHAIMHPTINTLFLSMNTYMVTSRFENEANFFADILTELDKDIHIC